MGPLKETSLIAKKKAEKLARLAERYYGKRDLLAEWDLYPGIDDDYRNDLKRRLIGYHNDLTYRGADII
jgi:hypothetical protein